MSAQRLIIKEKDCGIIVDGEPFLQRCPECDRENYIMNVALGVCTWCGFNANKENNDNSRSTQTSA